MKLRLRWLSGGCGPVAVAAAAAPAPSSIGVVIVPSIGHEANVMQPATAQLARQLATGGAATVVVQLAGTDQSHGTLDSPQLVDQWRASVRRSVSELTALGFQRPYVVACRVGATLLDGVVSPAETSGIVLWSPTLSGRRYVRELRLLQAGASYAGRRTDEVNVGGYSFPNELLKTISELRADPATLAGASRLLILDDDRRPCDPAALTQLSASSHVSHARVNDIGYWHDTDPDPSYQPESSITTIANWILDPQAQPHGPAARPGLIGSAVEVVDGVEEQFVSIGEQGLAGVFHQGDDPRQAALMLLSTAGPGRQFVELARSEARRGRTVLRFDLTGTGWSDPIPGGRPAFAYDIGAIDDITVATRWLQQRCSGQIVAVGFCAGGHALMEAAADAGYERVVSYNVEMFESTRPEPIAAAARTDRHRLVTLIRKLWRGLCERRRTRSMLRRFSGSGADLQLVFDRSELSVRYLKTFRTGRAALAGRDASVSVDIYDSLGHNLEGPDSAQAIAQITTLLEQLDSSELGAPRRDRVSAGRLVRRFAATLAIAAFDLAGGSIASTTPDMEFALELAETDEGAVRRSAHAHASRRRFGTPRGAGHRRPVGVSHAHVDRRSHVEPAHKVRSGVGYRVSSCRRCRVDR